MEERDEVRISEGSVFHALELANADDLVVRAELTRQIVRIIESRGFSQAQAARVLSMDQPRVSALVNGKISKFSTDRLIRALLDLGQDVQLQIRPAAGERGRASVAA